VLLAVIVGCLTCCGCASTYSSLKSEREIPRFASLSARAAAMPQFVTRVPTSRPVEPVTHLAITRTGNLNSDRPILVFVHGTFSDAKAWRYMAGALGDAYTLWLVDLPGCGASDKPSPSSIAADGYGPTALADRIYQALGQSLEGMSADRPLILIGHSLGALIVTRMLADPDLRARHARVRGHVAGVFLITPLDIAIEKPVPVLEEAARLSGLEVALGRLTGLLRERLAEGVLQSYDDASVAQREEVDRSVDIISSPDKRHAMQAMILQATPRRPGAPRPDWPAVDKLAAEYANIDVPTAIVCGAHDETLPAAMSYKLSAQIRGASLRVLPDCMHSPHLEHPQQCADALAEFVRHLAVTTRPSHPATRSEAGQHVLMLMD
jgi:2-hydroxy-6-oxonona-2,4-dienedioate hydrolase